MEAERTTDLVEEAIVEDDQSASISVDEKVQTSAQADGEEEEEECGFCIFMKAGPCGQRFTLWQDCVDGAEKSEKDIVQQCAQMTSLLKVCMEMNPQYYGPVLDAEKAMEAEVNSLEEKDAEKAKSREASAGGEGGGEEEGSVERTDEGQVTEAVEVLDVVVSDKEGQVVEAVEVVDAVLSDKEGQVVEAVEVVDAVVSDKEGQVIEAAEVVDAVVSDKEGQVIEAVEVVDGVVSDDEDDGTSEAVSAVG